MNTQRERTSRLGPRRRALSAPAGIVLLVLVVVGLRPATAAALSSGSDWPAYLHDVSGSGFTSETLVNPSNAAGLATKTGWPVQLSNAAVCPSSNDYCSSFIGSQPVVATVAGNTLVYVGTWNGSEYALCASSCSVGGTPYTSGQIVWSTYVGRTSGCGGPLNSAIHGVTSAAALATVQIAGVTRTVVYVGAGGDIALDGSVIANATSNLVALDASTGAVLWQTPLGSAPNYYLWSSPVYANGSLYIGLASTDDCPLVRGGLAQIDPASGAVLHTYYTVPAGCLGASVWGSAAVDATGSVYVATGNGNPCATSSEPRAVAVLKLSSTLQLQSSWKVPKSQIGTDSDFGSTPTLFTGTVTTSGAKRSLLGVANKNGTYYVFDRSRISSGPVKRIHIAVGGTNPEAGDGSISPSSFDGTDLYIAGGNTTIGTTSYTGSLRAYNPNNLSAPLWQDGFTAGPVLGAVTTDPGIAIASEGAFANVAKSSSGTVLFQGVGAQFDGAASIAYGAIYEGDTAGMLWAFSVNGQ